MKKCFKCGEWKPLSEFYRHKGMADGHLNKCKTCTKADVRRSRKVNIDHYREYDRQRGNRQSPDYHKEYRQKYPEKYRARTMVNNAIRDGKMKREEKCSECGAPHPHAHHDDYAYPLTVRWLCAACHSKWHAANGEGLDPF